MQFSSCFFSLQFFLCSLSIFTTTYTEEKQGVAADLIFLFLVHMIQTKNYNHIWHSYICMYRISFASTFCHTLRDGLFLSNKSSLEIFQGFYFSISQIAQPMVIFVRIALGNTSKKEMFHNIIAHDSFCHHPLRSRLFHWCPNTFCNMQYFAQNE